MSRKKRRNVPRLAGCETCSFLAAVSYLLEEAKAPGAVAECPGCKRELLIPMSPAVVGQTAFEKALHAVAAYIHVPGKPRATHFKFSLNGTEIFSDPGCGDEIKGRVVCHVRFEVPEKDFAKLQTIK